MGLELWSSKSLDLDWLPPSPLWHSPMMLRTSGGAWKWFYRVDVPFGAWASRTMARARAAGASLPGDPDHSLRVIRGYLDESQPGVLLSVDTLAGSPVKLPGEELMVDAAEFARWGWVPKAG